MTANDIRNIALLGHGGSGKTSLVNLITRFYDVNEGQVLVDGVDVRDYDLDTLRGKAAYILQKSELFAGTVAENGVVEVPETIGGKAVNAIDHTIFKYVDGLSKIVLPKSAENVWDIDEDSFPVEVVYGETQEYAQGDVNGDNNVDAADLALLKKVIAKLTPIDDPSVKNPNVDGVGTQPDAADLALLKKIIAKLV